MHTEKVKDVVILQYPREIEVTGRYCEVVGPHWPHVVEAVLSGEQDAPPIRTLCPGRNGDVLKIYEAWMCGSPEWLILDDDRERREHNVMARTYPEWVLTEYVYLEIEWHSYEGTRRLCRERMPHTPHVVSIYSTVRWGTMKVYCPGIPDGRMRIYEDLWRGDAQVPDQSVLAVIRL